MEKKLYETLVMKNLDLRNFRNSRGKQQYSRIILSCTQSKDSSIWLERHYKELNINLTHLISSHPRTTQINLHYDNKMINPNR